ncbi:uncharacterized protein [Nicotiana tomentosiformis]|uniref:uncharacterized protein n=1 Tax=Nicotiana tomentosiformis TaxID=4098 RepID=UPI00388C934C
MVSGRVRGKNGVCILVDRDLTELMVEVKRVNDRLMAIKIVVGGYTMNVVSVYAPLVGLDEEVKRRFWEDLDGFGDKNEGGTSLLEYAKAFELIDYLLLRKYDRGLCMDFSVIPSGNLTTQRKLLVMDLEIRWMRRKRDMSCISRFRWGAMTKDKAQELGEKFLAKRARRSSRDASCMWSMTANYIIEAAREVLGVSKGFLVDIKGTGGGMKMFKGK